MAKKKAPAAPPPPVEPEPEPAPPPPAPAPAPATRGLAYTELDEAATAALRGRADGSAAGTPNADRVARLAETLGVKHYGDNERSAILTDFSFYNIMLADEMGLTDEQTSALFSILRAVFEASFELPGAPPAAEQSFALFKASMLKHAVDAPPDGVALFSLDEVTQIADFVSRTLYRHYRLYAYCFRTREVVQHESRAVTVETPLVPRPLGEATVA